MKQFVIGACIAGLSLCLGANGLKAADARQELNAHVEDVNKAAKNKMETALHAVSVETGIPQERVETMHKNFPDVGPAGILMASVLADNTKKDPETFMRKHHTGTGWTAQARENNVSLDKLHERLDHLDKAVTNYSDNQNTKREKNRERK